MGKSGNTYGAEYHEKETLAEAQKQQIRLIAISKIEEFARMADAAVDTSALDSTPAIELIPLVCICCPRWNAIIRFWYTTAQQNASPEPDP